MLDWQFIGKTIASCATGIPTTIRLVLIPLLISIPFAYLIALVNMRGKSIWSGLFQVYISFVRSVPLILIIFLIYHAIPVLVNAFVEKTGAGIDIYKLDNLVYGYIVFTFVSIPTLSEIFRAGLIGIPKVQSEAAKSIGMTGFQAGVHIILPQVIERELPVLCTFVTNLIKMTSLAFCMSIMEITGNARVAAADSIRYIECYLVIFFMYLIICFLVERIFKLIEKRLEQRGRRSVDAGSKKHT